jgi:hypothetical protein
VNEHARKTARLHAAQKEGIHQSQEEAAMGEERGGEKALSISINTQDSTQPNIHPTRAGDAWPKPPLPSVLPKPSTNAVRASKDDHGEREGKWNTHKLGLRVGADALAAASAGVLVAPVITMIDKGIIENASGRNTLGESLKKSAGELLLKPHRFVASKPFLLIFVCYDLLPQQARERC